MKMMFANLPTGKLTLLVTIVVLVIATPAYAADSDVVLSLSPSSGTYQNRFPVDVTLNTGNKTAAAIDVVLDWNPQELGVTTANITAGTNLVVAAASVNDTERTIRFTVYNGSGQEISGKSVKLATLAFTPKKASSGSKVAFVTGAAESNKTGVYLTGENIITRTADGNYVLTTVESQSGGTTPTSGGTTTPTTGTGSGTSGGTTPSGSTDTAGDLHTASGEDILMFLTLFGLSLIGGGFLWVLIP